MTYNSYILLRGVKKNIFISYKAAIEVKRIFGDDKFDHDFVINIQDLSFRKGEIKYVEVAKDGSTSEDNQKVMDAFYAEERKNHAALSKSTPEYKANMLTVFTELYKIATDDVPSEEMLKQAYNVQLRFFIANPKRTICDAHLFKDIIPKVHSKRMNIWQSGLFRVVGEAMSRDAQLSR